mgnify:FL=1
MSTEHPIIRAKTWQLRAENPAHKSGGPPLGLSARTSDYLHLQQPLRPVFFAAFFAAFLATFLTAFFFVFFLAIAHSPYKGLTRLTQAGLWLFALL